MRRLIILLGLAISFALSDAAHADVPVLLQHQGRLLDAADTPVDGTVDLTFSIFEVPVAGAPLWSESHPGVSVSGGLFNTTLGSIVPLTADLLVPSSNGLPPATIERYLEVQVAGDPPLSPRVRLISAPYAVAASRVSGDIETQSGEFALRKNGGNVVGAINVNSGAALKLQHDEPADSMVLSTEASRTELAIKTKGTGAQRYSVLVGTTPDSGRIESEFDENGDGNSERRYQTLSNASSARTRWYADLDSDGSPEYISTQIADAAGARLAIKTKGTSAYRLGVTAGAGPDSSQIQCDSDEDGDGVPENSAELVTRKSMGRMKCSDITLERAYISSVTADSAGSSLQLEYKVNPQAARDNFLQGAADILQARLTLGSDSDGDGVDDVQQEQTTNGTGSSVQQRFRSGTKYWKFSCDQYDGVSTSRHESDSDGDGVVDNSVTQTSEDSTASVTVESRFAAGPRQSTSLDGSYSHARQQCVTDIDGDGIPDVVVASKTMATEASSEVGFDLDDDGILDRSIREKAGNGGVVIVLDGPSADGSFRSKTELNDTSVTNVLDSDSDNDGLSESQVESYCDSTTARIQAVRDSGPRASLQADEAGARIAILENEINRIRLTQDSLSFYDASGIPGAYCDGASWVNASDANAKENFETVDGAELLKQLEKLQITRWNYKTQPNAQHIGPTAQDFREVFSVGSDGKSISTIDPSGIALAAIKELGKQNQELEEQNRKLKDELEELKRRVNAFLSTER